MYEDASIELEAFKPGGRVFCIASAGCTALRLSFRHDVVAVDINPVQLAYAERRLAGAPGARGAAERLIVLGKICGPFLGWMPWQVRQFFDLEDPDRQILFWRRHLDTRPLRAALRALFSRAALRTVYGPGLLAFLPPRFGMVIHHRFERGFARHANRTNPYVRSFFLGEWSPAAERDSRRVRFVHADAASFLEAQPPGSFDGFSLSNILDGAAEPYRERLFAAVTRAAAPGAVSIVRSFREPREARGNRAAEDRAMLWGLVDVRPAAGIGVIADVWRDPVRGFQAHSLG
jgi:hypothetical protein